MITATMIDLCKEWRKNIRANQEAFLGVIHDAFAEAGYPRISQMHFLGPDKCSLGHDCALIVAVEKNDVNWLDYAERNQGNHETFP